MAFPGPKLGLWVLAPLVLGGVLISCHGGSGSSPSVPTPTFTLAAASTGIRIPSGGSGFVVVTISRLNGFQEAVDVSVVGTPAGINASGHIPRDASAFALPIGVAPEMTEQTFLQSQIRGVGGGLSQSVPFTIQVLPPLPPMSHSPHHLVAPGARQSATGTQNQAVAMESVQPSVGSQGATVHRSGFHPSGQPIR